MPFSFTDRNIVNQKATTLNSRLISATNLKDCSAAHSAQKRFPSLWTIEGKRQGLDDLQCRIVHRTVSHIAHLQFSPPPPLHLSQLNPPPSPPPPPQHPAPPPAHPPPPAST